MMPMSASNDPNCILMSLKCKHIYKKLGELQVLKKAKDKVVIVLACSEYWYGINLDLHTYLLVSLVMNLH